MIYPHKKFQSNLDINLAYNYWSVGLSSSGFLLYIHVKRIFGPGTFHTQSALLKGLGHEKNTVFFYRPAGSNLYFLCLCHTIFNFLGCLLEEKYVGCILRNTEFFLGVLIQRKIFWVVHI
jgi:hypothetical protein